MKEKKSIQFNFEDREEINHRFSGNIIRFFDDVTGQVVPFKLHSVNKESFEGELYLPNKGKYSMGLYKHTHTQYDWSFPELGYVNIDNLSVYLKRLPGKCYTRGYDKRYVDSRHSFREELRSLGLVKDYKDSGDGKLMFALFNREFDGFHTVLNSIEEGEYLARAFHKDWCIGIKLFSTKPILFYKNNMVGYCSDSVVKLVPHSEFLKESLSCHTKVEVVPDFSEIYQ
jgi:hypothetical protein